MEITNGCSSQQREYRPCCIEDPTEFHDSQCFRSDDDLLEYLNNLIERFKHWRDVRNFPNSRGAKTCQWRAEVIKNILNRRGVTVSDLYDEVFGFQPIKKQRVTLDTQAETRAAEQQLKDAKARYARSLAAKPPSPLGTETEDQTALDAIKVAYEVEEVADSPTAVAVEATPPPKFSYRGPRKDLVSDEEVDAYVYKAHRGESQFDGYGQNGVGV